MRKFWCLMLLTASLAGGPALAEPAAVNLALNRPHVSSGSLLPGWTGLVDGDRESDGAPGCYGTSNVGDLPKFVVVDLGAPSKISKVMVYNSGNGNTRTVSLSSSTDGSAWKKLRDPDFIFPDRDPLVLTVSFQTRQARYVRVTFRDTWNNGLGGNNCFFLRELEVYGQPGKADGGSAEAVATGQPKVTSTRLVPMFKRYCLQAPGQLRIAAVGDYTVISADQAGHWATLAADGLRQTYPDKKLTLEMVGGQTGSIAAGVEWATLQTPDLAPDLILVSYGGQAAASRADLKEFRTKYQTLLNQLMDHTAALVVVITPPPLVRAEGGTGADAGKPRSSQEYGWAVEQAAQLLGLPVVRTASVLAKVTGASTQDLLLDSQHLGKPGHEAMGLAIAELLR